MEPLFDNSREGLQVGSDKVLYYGDSVIVYATREMPDWQVREFCKIPIYFEERKFYLKRKSRMERPYAMGYELEPWPEDLHEESKLAINYDAEYVAQRDRLIRSDKRNDFGRAMLLPFFPLLGFLWSRFKDRELEPFGLNPVSMTKASLFLEFAIIVIEVVFLFILDSGFAQVVFGLATSWFDLALFLVLSIDAVVRYDEVLRGAESPSGLVEWMPNFFRRKRRNRRVV
jgi:hypothetical protein